MHVADLIANYPRLFHMAEDGSWDSIKQNGQLSTSALLNLYGVDAAQRLELVSQRRPQSVSIGGANMLPATVRDQKPMTEAALKKCLIDGTTPREWFELLNDRAFFWLSKVRLNGLLGARAYRGRPQIVLTVDTERLVSAHRDRIELSPINSGATIYRPAPRSRETFLPIDKYPFDHWPKKKRKLDSAIVELVVVGGVPDTRDHLIAVHRIENGNRQKLWGDGG